MCAREREDEEGEQVTKLLGRLDAAGRIVHLEWIGVGPCALQRTHRVYSGQPGKPGIATSNGAQLAVRFTLLLRLGVSLALERRALSLCRPSCQHVTLTGQK